MEGADGGEEEETAARRTLRNTVLKIGLDFRTIWLVRCATLAEKQNDQTVLDKIRCTSIAVGGLTLSLSIVYRIDEWPFCMVLKLPSKVCMAFLMHTAQ